MEVEAADIEERERGGCSVERFFFFRWERIRPICRPRGGSQRKLSRKIQKQEDFRYLVPEEMGEVGG